MVVLFFVKAVKWVDDLIKVLIESVNVCGWTLHLAPQTTQHQLPICEPMAEHGLLVCASLVRYMSSETISCKTP